MTDIKSNFGVGYHRAVYLWAGPGTIRMNQLKFMGANCDEDVHVDTHSNVGAQRMSEEAGFNWAYMMYDWGFPPEIEIEDWEDFKKTVPIYHDSGIRVFGYIQTSNCVYQGSYIDKDWYAKDPKGRFIHYYTGRYMTCYLNRDWIHHLQDMVDGVINAGADGVFFDNPWFGIQPIHFGGTWAGPTGCYCAQCQKTFSESFGFSIPVSIHPETDPNSRTYLEWRASRVTETICNLAEYARSRNPGILISVNNYDAIMHPTYISHGINLSGLARCQDVVMIENFSLPRYQDGLLINNALTIRTALAYTGDTPLTTNPYDKGIGFDKVYPSRRIQLSIVEAAACGTAMVVKGTEFIDDNGTFTLLTAKEYKSQREATGKIQNWLAEKADLYQNRRNISKVGLLLPEKEFKSHWDQVATTFFRVCQTLTLNGIPWRVLHGNQSCSELELVFDFVGNHNNLTGLNIVYVSYLPGLEFPPPSFLSKHPFINELNSKMLSWFYRAYFDHPLGRRLMDSLGLPQWFLGSPHFKIPPITLQKKIIKYLEGLSEVTVTGSDAPVLIEHWEKDDRRQIHLVNYGTTKQLVTVRFPEWKQGVILSPTQPESEFSGTNFSFYLDLYTILIYS